MKRRRRQQPLTVLIVPYSSRAPISIRIPPWTIKLALAILAVIVSVAVFQVRKYVAERHQLERRLAALQREKWIDLSRRQQMERVLRTQATEIDALHQEVATLTWWTVDDIEAMAQDVEVFQDDLTGRVNELENTALTEVDTYEVSTKAEVEAFKANTVADVEAFKASTRADVEAFKANTTAEMKALFGTVGDEIADVRATLAAIERVSDEVQTLVGLDQEATPGVVQSTTANIGGPGPLAIVSTTPGSEQHKIGYGEASPGLYEVISPEFTVKSAEVQSLHQLRTMLPGKLAELQQLKKRVLKRLDVLDPAKRTDPKTIEYALRLWDAAPKAWPTERAEITSGFGYRTINGVRDFHTGIDIGVWYYTEVRAVKGGRVTKAGWQPGYGWTVEIEHEMGFSTLYAHLRRYYPDAGDVVEAGEVIGQSGGSGNTTGPHLHYEIRLNGTPVDPMRYLNAGN